MDGQELSQLQVRLELESFSIAGFRSLKNFRHIGLLGPGRLSVCWGRSPALPGVLGELIELAVITLRSTPGVIVTSTKSSRGSPGSCGH